MQATVGDRLLLPNAVDNGLSVRALSYLFYEVVVGPVGLEPTTKGL